MGSHYEVTGSQVTKYYFAGSQRVAMRTGSTLSYLLSDHLGSTSITTNSSGALVAELRYKPWGEVRYNSGVTPTKYQFTGQFSYQSDFGLLFYNARWYDSSIGRFAQADTITPSGVQGLDRYAYVNNSPVNFTDPSGHITEKALYFEGDGPLPMASYGVHFTGRWSSRELLNIAQGVRDVGTSFALAREKGESSATAFQAGYGTDSTPLYYLHGNTSNEFWYDGSGVDENGNPLGCEISAGACTVGLTTRTDGQEVYLIKIVTMSLNPLSARNNMVHELGHLFGSRVVGYDELKNVMKENPGLFDRPNTQDAFGFASSGFPWQQATHDVNRHWEIFADQFLGWTYNTWQSSIQGGIRSSWMNINMASWLAGR